MTGEQAGAAAGAVVGLPWAEAEHLLETLQVPYQTMVTRPPGRPEGVGELRVVGVRATPDSPWVIILAHRDYRSGSPPPT